jgi:hypothetical protein
MRCTHACVRVYMCAHMSLSSWLLSTFCSAQVLRMVISGALDRCPDFLGQSSMFILSGKMGTVGFPSPLPPWSASACPAWLPIVLLRNDPFWFWPMPWGCGTRTYHMAFAVQGFLACGLHRGYHFQEAVTPKHALCQHISSCRKEETPMMHLNPKENEELTEGQPSAQLEQWGNHSDKTGMVSDSPYKSHTPLKTQIIKMKV